MCRLTQVSDTVMSFTGVTPGPPEEPVPVTVAPLEGGSERIDQPTPTPAADRSDAPDERPPTGTRSGQFDWRRKHRNFSSRRRQWLRLQQVPRVGVARDDDGGRQRCGGGRSGVGITQGVPRQTAPSARTMIATRPDLPRSRCAVDLSPLEAYRVAIPRRTAYSILSGAHHIFRARGDHLWIKRLNQRIEELGQPCVSWQNWLPDFVPFAVPGEKKESATCQNAHDRSSSACDDLTDVI